MDSNDVFKELTDPTSEMAAMREFAQGLRDKGEFRRVSIEAKGEAPDFWLRADGTKIGVEVTTLQVCNDVRRGNARVRQTLDRLRSAVSDILCPRGLGFEIVMEPRHAEGLPDRRKGDAFFRTFADYVAQFVHWDMCAGGLCWREVILWVLTRSYGPPGIHVADQGFILVPQEGDWGKDINEAVTRKIQKYGRRLCTPCWLLINLKDYFSSDSDNRTFLAKGVRVYDYEEVRQVFDRVYAITAYVPAQWKTVPLCRLL